MKKTIVRMMAILLAVLSLAHSANLTLLAESAEKINEINVITEGENDVETPEGSPILSAKSAILMEANTGTVLYTKNADEALPPASVTKIMTLLLIMEAIDEGRIKLTDTVTVSANAASMGGSQIYLKEGEQMILEDLLKSVVIASANDAAVALAEYLYGSVDTFVAKMNQRANDLGMVNTRFENATGLDDTAVGHLTSARDISIMSRELIRHDTILKYSSIWMDTIRDGAFGLTNTNRLVRFYKGCTGLKTGSTSKAGFCVSVTAERDGMSLICVIMGAETRDIRNAEATMLLDWGFSSYGVFEAPAEELEAIPVKGGKEDTCKIMSRPFSCVLPKEVISSVERTVELPGSISAPVSKGERIGTVRFRSGEAVIGECEILSLESVEKINFFEILRRMAARFLLV